MDEYLRRNLLVCQAVGVRAGLTTILHRVEKSRGFPKWIRQALKAELERMDGIPDELAKHRDEVGYGQE